jgi:hypothetical protein
MKRDIQSSISTLKILPVIIENYFNVIPESKLDVKRNGEAWSIREHLYHIVSVQEMLLKRIKMILQDESPVLKPYFPENGPDRESLFDSIESAF